MWTLKKTVDKETWAVWGLAKNFENGKVKRHPKLIVYKFVAFFSVNSIVSAPFLMFPHKKKAIIVWWKNFVKEEAAATAADQIWSFTSSSEMFSS